MGLWRTQVLLLSLLPGFWALVVAEVFGAGKLRLILLMMNPACNVVYVHMYVDMYLLYIVYTIPTPKVLVHMVVQELYD